MKVSIFKNGQMSSFLWNILYSYEAHILVDPQGETFCFSAVLQNEYYDTNNELEYDII